MISKFIPVLLAVIGLGVFFTWVESSTYNFSQRVPGADAYRKPVVDAAVFEFDTYHEASEGKASAITGAWPRFRGSDFSAIYRDDSVTLARDFSGGGPEQMWAVELGEGYAGAAILNGRAYVLDYDEKNKEDLLRCLSLDDGKDIWRLSYPVKVKRWHGMSRTVPAVTDKYLLSLGPKGNVVCCNSQTGDFLWHINLVQRYKTRIPDWHAAQCPIIDNGRAIIAPSGSVLMTAIACEPGEEGKPKVLWETPNEKGWKMTHSSIVPMEFGGKKMYIYCGDGGVAGISAEDGRILWQTDVWRMRFNVPSPVPVGDGKIFFAAGYDAGCLMLQLSEVDGEIKTDVVFRQNPLKDATAFGTEQHTPVFYNGYLYGVRLKDGQLVCLDLNGQAVWASGSAHKIESGPLMVANGLIYAMDDSGLLKVVEATHERFNLLTEAQVLHGREAWGPMAMVSGRLIVRDLTQMVCLDMRTK
ncbi:MAG: PQQ-like beta-propeller repeat protein [Phycisphaerae bacterium]|nr:PQQ-like beta-propeller repeat protein [Phycisphaerae bacterium]